ncbi:hypothetical protein RhiirA1_52528 [Rhizophagus irregularis]|uniref:FAM192A/Fyv6 N-terminal domain-containing protein n=1 Tax=Rhizophagus irregularis TaxID=588596 RepID=A0A2N0S8L9_9GLOM|nr:hypothetical protein RhiirA1_52528 [Rhizophagus irregularis]
MENKFVSSKELEEARLKRQEEWKKAFERIGESSVTLFFFVKKVVKPLLLNLLTFRILLY